MHVRLVIVRDRASMRGGTCSFRDVDFGCTVGATALGYYKANPHTGYICDNYTEQSDLFVQRQWLVPGMPAPLILVQSGNATLLAWLFQPLTSYA